jgi:hypothetical protein
MHPLDGPRLKINRAKAEINKFRSMQDTFFENTHYYVVRAEQNPESGKRVYRTKIDGPPPPPDWSIYVGEIAHNLRSALNQLVYQLAFLNGSNVPETITGDKKLQFPVFLTRDKFIAKGQRMIKLLRPEHQASIERLQPYNTGNSVLDKTMSGFKWSGSNTSLLWLEDINNADKHRLIQVIGTKAAAFGLSFWEADHPDPFIRDGDSFGILEDGAKFGEADPKMHVDAQIHPLIAFANGCDTVRGKGVYFVLDIIEIRVSEIIDSFASEFD